MKRYFALGLTVWVLALGGARADGPDDEYVQIYNVIQQADTLSSSGAAGPALAKYQEAQAALQRFHRAYPEWNPQVFNFRMGYVAGQIDTLSSKVPPAPKAVAASSNAPPATAPPATAPPVAAPPVAAPRPAPVRAPEVLELEKQVGYLREQLRYMQSDKQLLEAKLKEALSAQPAAVDPRELARAQARVTELEKENDLLRVTLSEDKAKAAPATTPEARAAQPAAPGPAPDSKALAAAQAGLAAANRQLAEQTQKANTLAQEKQFLETKLAHLSAGPENAAALESTRKALSEAKRQLAQEQEASAKLAREKEVLQARVRSANAEGETLAALRAENALLKKQAQAEAATTAGSPAPASRDLAQAQAQVAALESERDVLRVEKEALQNRLHSMSAEATSVASAPAPVLTNPVVLTNTVVQTRTVVVTNTVAVASAPREESARYKALERERTDLQKQLKAANKELNRRKSRATAARVTELETQVAALQTRLDVYETRRVPFTAEELATFNQPAPAPVERVAVAAPARPVSQETIALVRDAQRYFADREYDKAADAYVQVLHQDRTNVVALANLATIQLENNQLDAAETNIVQALVLAPDDAYSLSILGFLRYRQHQYDAALDALGRAAKLDPQNAQVQNYLGVTLAEKGLRGPAEAAFRKAIEIQPNYADAHVNLALIYVAQQPPATELARWHYQRALNAGHAHEPYLDKALAARQ